MCKVPSIITCIRTVLSALVMWCIDLYTMNCYLQMSFSVLLMEWSHDSFCICYIFDNISFTISYIFHDFLPLAIVSKY